MKTSKSIREIKLKTGAIIPTGTSCTIAFNQTIYATVSPDGFAPYTTRAANLHRSFTGFSNPPSLDSLERQMSDGICKTVMGERTEPDGYDEHGSPSWMLALGYI